MTTSNFLSKFILLLTVISSISAQVNYSSYCPAGREVIQFDLKPNGNSLTGTYYFQVSTRRRDQGKLAIIQNDGVLAALDYSVGSEFCLHFNNATAITYSGTTCYEQDYLSVILQQQDCDPTSTNPQTLSVGLFPILVPLILLGILILACRVRRMLARRRVGNANMDPNGGLRCYRNNGYSYDVCCIRIYRGRRRENSRYNNGNGNDNDRNRNNTNRIRSLSTGRNDVNRNQGIVIVPIPQVTSLEAMLLQIKDDKPEVVKKKSKKSKNSKEEDSSCVICMDKTREIKFEPCGHICVCYDCALKLAKNTKICPLCRQNIGKVKKSAL